MKTTPGPWLARNNGHFWEVGTSLAEFAHSVAHVPQSAFMPGDAEANARLLASAPDLLAERDRLKALNAELVKALEIYAKEDNWCADSCGVNRIWQEPDSTSPEAYDGFDTARAALAKHKETT